MAVGGEIFSTRGVHYKNQNIRGHGWYAIVPFGDKISDENRTVTDFSNAQYVARRYRGFFDVLSHYVRQRTQQHEDCGISTHSRPQYMNLEHLGRKAETYLKVAATSYSQDE